MAENHNPDRFAGLTPKEEGFFPDDFTPQNQATGRFRYLGGTNFEGRPLQSGKYGKKEGKKRRRV